MKTISNPRMHLCRLLSALALVLAAIFLPSGGVRSVGTLTVTNGNNDGPGSLRQAIAEAGVGNIIYFDNDYTITLEKTGLTIGKDLTIDGEKFNIVISGDDALRVFYVNSGATVNLNSLTITQGTGTYGGGIFNDGTVNLSTSTVSANHVSNDGGGIYNSSSGALTITDSTLSGNSAAFAGGGFENTGTATITNSTFSTNSADIGGGLDTLRGKTTITNSTFSANSASFGGGIRDNRGTTTLRNTILANSTGGNCDGGITDGGNNIDDGTTCGFLASGSMSSTNPLLGALGSYGGPTQTFALLPDSAAINAGNDTICALAVGSPNYGAGGLDQRGVARPPSACDIGAFESRGFTLAISGGNNQLTPVNSAFNNPLQVSVSALNAAEPVNGGTVTFTPPAFGASVAIAGSPGLISGGHAQVTATANNIIGSYNVSASTRGATSGVDFALQNTCAAITVTNSSNAGSGSLRQAIADICAGGTINFAGNYTINLAATLTIDKNMTIDGNGHTVTVSGQDAVRVFMVSNGFTFNLDHLNVAGGFAIFGGGIGNAGILTIANSTFSANSAAFGGGIDNYGTLSITNSTFSGNHVDITGGGIINEGTLSITNSTFSANSAGNFGGGIDNFGILTIANSTFSANSASLGGGIRDNSGTTTLRNTILANSTFGGNCSGAITDGGNNIDNGTTCGFSASGSMSSADPLLGSLANNGGATLTFALLPGSAAINAGSTAICSAAPVNGLDQRGMSRPGACDIGAFESSGFALTVSSGNNQSTMLNSAFASPLVVGVASPSGEPVNGGTVTFLPPTPGASAVITGSPAIISGGQASVTAVANGIPGSYNVNASTRGASVGADFALQNTCGTFIVTNSNDDGSGSLRQAIANVCPGGTINFAGNYTIYLAGTLTIDKNMTIDGAGHTVTVSGDTLNDGSGNVRVFYVNSGVIFNLSYLIITKGYSNSGGGIDNEGGTVTITNSTLSANIATFGGGILNYGLLTITNSTFSGNSAPSGGGIDNYGPLTITNSTFSANSAGTSGISMDNHTGIVTITNSTFSGIGRGISNGVGTVTLRNTILANSTGGNCSGAITDGGNNIDDGTTCGFSASGSMSSTNPLLGTLGSYGGPTQTFALLPGSAAINSGNDTICAEAVGSPNYGAGGLDQRGVARPPSACDIGAFESRGFTLAISGGNNQLTPVNSAFASPLVVGVSSPSGEPVDGGKVTFLPPATGASAVITGSPANISGGQASVTAIANGTFGAYQVTASANGVVINVGFDLENTQNEYTLTITSANGTVAKSPNQATYHEGDVIQLTATPNTGWAFVNWTGGLTGSINPGSVTIHGNTSITANYTQNTYRIYLPLVMR
jgi:hypothetical protein